MVNTMFTTVGAEHARQSTLPINVLQLSQARSSISQKNRIANDYPGCNSNRPHEQATTGANIIFSKELLETEVITLLCMPEAGLPLLQASVWWTHMPAGWPRQGCCMGRLPGQMSTQLHMPASYRAQGMHDFAEALVLGTSGNILQAIISSDRSQVLQHAPLRILMSHHS